jgi:hypothetical protein
MTPILRKIEMENEKKTLEISLNFPSIARRLVALNRELNAQLKRIDVKSRNVRAFATRAADSQLKLSHHRARVHISEARQSLFSIRQSPPHVLRFFCSVCHSNFGVYTCMCVSVHKNK